MKRSLLLLSVLVLLLPGCERSKTVPNVPDAGQSEAAKAGPAADAGTLPPANDAVTLQIKDYDGILALVRDKQGKVVVLDAWSTWCEPCMREFPGLVALHEKYGPDRVACISLSLDFDGIGDEKPEQHRDKVLAFLNEQGAAFDNLISSDPSEELYKKLGFASVPAVFVYDRQGQLARRFDNTDAKREPFTYQDVEALVVELLEAQ
ncbi:MAG: TlpA disulfide reductase family protein [Pirellulales bacterium]